MATFGTGDLKNLPRTIADGMVTDAITGSTVASLSGRKPMRFGITDIITFNDRPRAEFVAEGADKTSTTGSFDVVQATPKKAQVTMRFNEEVQWADEDYQLTVLSTLAEAGSVALSRALDLGLFYRLNPLTGTPIAAWTNYLNTTGHRTPATDDPDKDIEQAVGKLLGANKPVNGIAFDPSYVWKLATLRYNDGRKIFPDLGYTVSLSNFSGLNASTSSTVSGQPEGPDTKVRAIVGDWQTGIYWGVQRDIPLEVIRFGDPDGQGDLKRANQIALRLEIVYGWHVFADRFSVIEETTPKAPAK